MVRLLTAFVVLLLLVPDVFAQGKLEQAREEIFAPPSGSSSTPSSSGSKSTGLAPSCDDGDSLLGQFYLALFLAPFTLPRAAFETISLEPNFPAQPYAGVPGYLTNGDHPGKWLGLGVSIEGGTNFNGLTRFGLRAWLDTSTRWGVVTDWDHYLERGAGTGTDALTLGDLMLTYRFVQAETVQMHVGAGVRTLFTQPYRDAMSYAYQPADDGTFGSLTLYPKVAGVNLLYSADVFPVKPLVVSARAEAGNLNSTFVARLRGSVGVQLRHGELFLGYDWVHIGSVALHGPLAGLRLWF